MKEDITNSSIRWNTMYEAHNNLTCFFLDIAEISLQFDVTRNAVSTLIIVLQILQEISISLRNSE